MRAAGSWRQRAAQALGIQPGEVAAGACGFAFFFFLFCGYFMLRPIRETLGIQAGVDQLQWLFTATFLAMLAVVPLFGWLSARVPRATLVTWAYAVFAMLVSPLVRRMQGREELFPPVSRLPLRTEHPRQDSREEFLRVQRRAADDGNAELVPYGHQGSGVISSLPWSTGLARLPADVQVQDRDRVPYYDLRHWLA